MHRWLLPIDGLIDRLPFSPRFFRFCVVGSSGVLVNFAVLALALQALPQVVSRHRWAMAAAIIVSVFTNFLLNDGWTWRDRRRAGVVAWFGRLWRFFLVSLLAAVVQWVAAVLLFEQLPLQQWLGGVAIYLAQATGIVIAMAINFGANHLWTFGAGAGPQPPVNSDG